MSVYETLANKMVQLIESSGTLPWTNPWKQINGHAGAINGISGKPYRGFYNLSMTSFATTPIFYSFKQATELGGVIKKGNHGVPILYYTMLEKQGTEPSNGDEETKRFPFMRYTTVFSVDQIDFPKKVLEGILNTYKVSEPVEHTPTEAEKIFIDFCAEQNIKLSFGGNKACYSPAFDTIKMPSPGAFTTVPGFIATLYHEGAHATGAKHRLNRDINNFFGTQRYATEELIAELSSIYSCNRLGVLNQELEMNSAAYLQGWIKKLKDNPKEVLAVMSKAQKASEFILGASDDAQSVA